MRELLSKLLSKLRFWLLNKLGAVPMEDYMALDRAATRLSGKIREETIEHLRLISRFAHAVQEICRRSENSYYNWCCDYCCARGENCKADGWCGKFWPKKIARDD